MNIGKRKNRNIDNETDRLPTVSYQQLLEYALKLLSRRRYTVSKLREKLERRARFCAKTELFDEVTARLVELKYLDDEAFAKDYINDRINFKPRGKFLLKRELKLKGISPEIIETAIKKQEIDESALAAECLKKYSKKLIGLDTKRQRERAFRLLASRGFDLDTIYKTINS